MADRWYYMQGRERQGPVSFPRLQTLAKEGWLTPDDLVWKDGTPDWVPAGQVHGLFGSALSRRLAETIDGVICRPAVNTQQPAKPQSTDQPPRPESSPVEPDTGSSGYDWSNPLPRHLLAGCGGVLAALGLTFTAIAQSPLALAFTLGGLALAAMGLYVEIGQWLGQAIENIRTLSREAAERRLEAMRLAVEKQRLDLEAKKLAHEQAALEPVGNVVVITDPPMQKWSPGLAALLSFFIPGLGQLYKGQILNGIVWFFMVGFGYMALILPGLVLHFFCVLGALSGNPWTEGKTTVVRE
jgi:hypothetical protein